jgi:hypothetical protein
MQVHKQIVGDYVAIVEHDTDPQSPAEWDNFGTLKHWHNRYAFGDGKITTDEADDIKNDTDKIWLPVYMYDHSGSTINTTGFSCGWDSGQVGIIYADKDQIKVEGLNPDDTEAVKERLRGTVEAWDRYMRGEIYQYAVYKIDTKHEDCPEDLEKADVEESYAELVDSCGGFYGESSYPLSEAVAVAEVRVKQDEEEASKVSYWQSRDVVTV